MGSNPIRQYFHGVSIFRDRFSKPRIFAFNIHHKTITEAVVQED